MKEVRFALGYMPHHVWGNLIQAQLLEKDSGKEFYTPIEFVQNDPETRAYSRLSPMQREVVKLIDGYSDRNLHRVFAKKGTVKEFMDRMDPSMLEDHIRPFIERVLFRILEIARENRILLFLREKSARNVFPDDFVQIGKEEAEPLFSFRAGETLSYRLMLHHRDHELILRDRPVEVVCNDPAVILVDRSLYFIRDIDARKLKPFLGKDEVKIPASAREKYLASFVRNSIRDFRTQLEGIELEEVAVTKKAALCMEIGLGNSPVWILEFTYGKRRILSDSPLSRFVDYKSGGERPHFSWSARDRSWEEATINNLKEQGLRSRDDKVFRLNENFTKPGENDLYPAIQFVNDNGHLLEESGIGIRHRLAKDYYLGKLALELDSQEKNDWFDIKARVRIGGLSIPFYFLKDHILNGEREYLLPDGRVMVLPGEWFSRYRAMFEFGKVEKEIIRVQRQHFSMMDDSVRAFHRETMEKLERLGEAEKLPLAPVPGGLEAELRPYQAEGYSWLCYLQNNGFGGCLADDMGLGKTLQTLAVLMRSKEQELPLEDSPAKDAAKRSGSDQGQLSLFNGTVKKRTSLVVVPASLLRNWMSECRRFVPSFKVLSHVGIQRNRELSNFSYYDLVISTYHTVRQDIERFAGFNFHYVILDESQMIKNPASKLYQAVVELRSEYRLVLTGTPIENSLTDLWAQVSFINPGLLGSLAFFRRSFVQAIERKKDELQEERLRELIRPFILRRTKEEVAPELPPVLEQVRFCSMTEDQRRIYEEEKSQVRNAILENLESVGMEKSSMVVLQALTRLRQISNHPGLLEDYPDSDSGKFNEVARDVESVLSEGHRVLIFSSFVKHLELFRVLLEEQGVRYSMLTGAHNTDQREKAVKQFQAKNGSRVFLISLKAGGVGLNLTAADYVFILDPWWNPAAEMQALSRAHRIGQDKRVFVYRFISEGSIEEKIQLLQEGKKELADAFVSSANPLRELNEKELVELFS